MAGLVGNPVLGIGDIKPEVEGQTKEKKKSDGSGIESGEEREEETAMAAENSIWRRETQQFCFLINMTTFLIWLWILEVNSHLFW